MIEVYVKNVDDFSYRVVDEDEQGTLGGVAAAAYLSKEVTKGSTSTAILCDGGTDRYRCT